MEVEFYELDTIIDKKLTFAVINAIYQNKWIYVRHKQRNTWEIPGGHRELGEDIMETAKRELFEETGAKMSEIIPLCDYSTNGSSGKIFGRLFFSNIIELGNLPDSEIVEINFFDKLPIHLTYSEVQPQLFEKTIAFLKGNKVPVAKKL